MLARNMPTLLFSWDLPLTAAVGLSGSAKPQWSNSEWNSWSLKHPSVICAKGSGTKPALQYDRQLLELQQARTTTCQVLWVYCQASNHRCVPWNCNSLWTSLIPCKNLQEKYLYIPIYIASVNSSLTNFAKYPGISPANSQIHAALQDSELCS